MTPEKARSLLVGTPVIVRARIRECDGKTIDRDGDLRIETEGVDETNWNGWARPDHVSLPGESQWICDPKPEDVTESEYGWWVVTRHGNVSRWCSLHVIKKRIKYGNVARIARIVVPEYHPPEPKPTIAERLRKFFDPVDDRSSDDWLDALVELAELVESKLT